MLKLKLGVPVNVLSELRRALSISQHHDAITGTAKQFVNDNYVRLFGKGLDQTFSALQTALGQFNYSDGN